MRNYSSYVLIGLIPFLFFSCFAAKDYERPEKELTLNDYYRTDKLAADSLSMALFSWKEVFTDTILQRHIDTGLEKNIDIRVALQQMLIAQAYVKQGKLPFFPA